ncbi:MAG: LysE family translocator [candidate division Zixibacteria bacterium]|nr:LysE family translocator [candidate division Zixibacteria bacterium]
MVDQSTLTFLIAAIVLTITPGNDTMLTIRNSLSGHRPTGFATLFGICSGLIVHGTFAALGISVILVKSTELFAIVKYIGAGYLVLLGLMSIRSGIRSYRAKTTEGFIDQHATPAPLYRSFSEGFLSNVLNPKVALFYLSFLPQFIAPSDPFIKPLVLAGINLMMGILWLSALVLLINRLRVVLARPRNKAIIESVAGTMLVGLGIRLAVDR